MEIGRKVALWKLLYLLVAANLLAACSGGGGTDSPTSTTTAGATTASDAPTISGSPPTVVVAGQTYNFQPSVTNPGSGALGFSISNKPAWAAFNTATGLLSGTPTAAEAATFSNITISVSSGSASASLAPFAIVVMASSATGSATLTWEAPAENTNGSPLTDLSGYTIYYGTDSEALTQTVQIADPTQTTYVVNNLSAGTYYFSVAADASDGTQSEQSTLGTKTIL